MDGEREAFNAGCLLSVMVVFAFVVGFIAGATAVADGIVNLKSRVNEKSTQ